MSAFSGKCDFCDHIHMNENPEETIKNITVYIHGKDLRRHPLKIDTLKDAVKYYPYIIGCGAWSDGHGVIELSSRCFIDSEEEEHLGWYLEDALKYWRKCKRNKIPFDKKECFKKISFLNSDRPFLQEIVYRVEQYGDKATIKGLHDSLWEHYRRDWFDEMVSAGYGEYEAFCWCFNEIFPEPDVIKNRLGRDIKWANEEK